MTSFSWNARKQFYERASAQYENGLSLTEILMNYRTSLMNRGKEKAAAAVYQIWRRVRNGDKLATAIGSDMSDLERTMIFMGESSGMLPLAMRLIVEISGRTSALKWRLIASMFPPVVYLLSIYATLFIVGAMTLGPFLDLIPIEKWTGWAYVLYLMGMFAVSWAGPATVALCVALCMIGIRAMPRWSGDHFPRARIFFDHHIMGFSAYRELNGFTWILGFSALVRSMPESEALASQIRSANPWLASRLRPILLGIRNGLSLDEAMRRAGTGFPSPDLIEEIGAYAGKAGFPDRIEAVARTYAERLERMLVVKMAIVTAIFTGAMFFIMAAIQFGSSELSTLLSSALGG